MRPLIESIPVYLAGPRSKPTQSTTFAVDLTAAETVALIETILPGKINSSKFRYNERYGFYEAKTRWTILSWGEIVCIKVTQINLYKTQLSIVSQSRLGTTLFDWGKSFFNIQQIRSAFNQPNCYQA